MKKKICILVMALAMLLMLSACGCEHEWAEATCLTPKTCTKCEEVEGEALGHDWAAATCTAPETCTRCGETQGEMLPHTYGEWVMGETEMTRTCVDCGAEESDEIDYALFAKKAILGKWEFYLSVLDGKPMDAYDIKDGIVYCYVEATEDGKFHYELAGGTVYDYNWEFLSYDPESKGFAYQLTSEEADGTIILSVVESAAEDAMLMYLSDTEYIALFQDDQLTEGVLGPWVSTENGQISYLELAEDHTFTGDVNGEVTGSWHIKPITTAPYSEDMKVFAITFDGTRGEEPFAITVNSYLYGEDPYASLHYGDFSVSIDGEYLTFSHSGDDGVAALKTAIEEAPKKVLGTWTSKTVTAYKDSDSESRTTTDYTMTFMEDGTFTAQLDEPYTGTWEVDDVSASGSSVSYRYTMHLAGVSETMSVNFYDYDGNLTANVFDQKTGTSYNLNFAQLSEEQLAEVEKGPTLAIGTWTAVEGRFYNSETQTQESYDVSGWSLTVNEDGTYTAHLNTDVTGTWYFYDYSTADFNEGHEYNFQPDGGTSGNIYTINPEGQLDIWVEIDGQYMDLTMEKNS